MNDTVSRRRMLIGGSGVAIAAAGAAALGYRSLASTDEYDMAVARTRAALSARPETRDLIRYATLAANSHNTQPWLFRIGENRIDLVPDFSRRTPAVDPDDHHLFVSLGCAAENFALASAASGHRCDVRFDPARGGSVVILQSKGPPKPSALFDAIPRRQSTRAVYDGRPVAATELRLLEQAAIEPGVGFVMLTDRPKILQVRDLVLGGNSVQMADPAFLRELKHWMRFTPARAIETGDGLFTATTGNPIVPDWFGPVLLDHFFDAKTENAKYAAQIESSAGIAVFVGARADPAHWVGVGRASQRFALQATALGLKVAMVNQPVEVAQFRPDLARVIGAAGQRPDMVIRFGHGPTLPFSCRRPVDAVLA